MKKISNQTKHGFTLIEMMIAIGLGMMVVYITMSGLRTASQSISIAQRLSNENSIIRAGMYAALADADLWLSHDDPYDFKNKAGRQALRNPSVVNGIFQGLPFTPFRDGTLYKRSGTPVVPGQINTAIHELDGGWDPNAWAAHETRGWSWGNLVERVPVHTYPLTDKATGLPAKDDKGKQRYGDGHNFQNNDSNRAARKRQVFGSYHQFASTELTAPHSWQQRQLDGIKRTLGSYGLFEYLPANSGLHLYNKRNSKDIWAVSPEWCYTGGGKDNYYLGGDGRSGGINFAQDAMHATLGTVFAPPDPLKPKVTSNDPDSPRSIDDLRNIASRRYGTGISLDVNSNDGSVTNVSKLLSEAETSRMWLDQANNSAPEQWPTLRVATLRHVRTGAVVCLNRITWVSPFTGKETEFTFTVFGTNLRGARQQRARDSAGWVDPFPATGRPVADLDDY